MSFPGGSEVKTSQCRRQGLDPWVERIPGLEESPGGGNGNPLQYSCLENHMNRGSLGYSPWGHKELDKTE